MYDMPRGSQPSQPIGETEPPKYEQRMRVNPTHDHNNISDAAIFQACVERRVSGGTYDQLSLTQIVTFRTPDPRLGC